LPIPPAIRQPHRAPRLAPSAFVLFLSLFLTPLFPHASSLSAQEKVYEIADLKARLELRPDGSYRIREEITYDFQAGSFTFAVRDIPLSNSDGVSTVSVQSRDVTISGIEQEEEGGSWRVRWNFPPTTGLATFVLEYDIRGAVREVDETNEVFWRVVGGGWDVPFRQVEAEVVVPAELSVPASALTLDPPEIATIGTEGENVVARFVPGPLPAGRAYQVRVTFPKIMEGRLVGFARPEVRALLVGALAFVLFLLIGGIIAHRRGGVRLPPRSQTHPGVDIPSAAVLLHRSSPAWERAFPATLFDIANRGAISLERIDHKKRILTTQKVVLRRNQESEERLTDFEGSFLAKLETYEDLEEFASDGKKFRSGVMEKVRDGLITSGDLTDDRSAANRAVLLAVLLFVLAAAVFVAGAVKGHPWLMALAGAGIGVAAGFALNGGVRFPLTRQGAEHLAALKGYLEGLREELQQKVKMSPIQAAEFLFSALPWLTLDPKYQGAEARKLARALKEESGELRTPPWALDRTREFEKAAANKSAAYMALLPVTNITKATSGAVAPSAGGGGVGGASGGGGAGGGGGGAG